MAMSLGQKVAKESTVGVVKYNEYVIFKKQYVKGGSCRTGWV
jgi:hypothetical protein